MTRGLRWTRIGTLAAIALARRRVSSRRASFTYRGDAQVIEQAWQEMKAFLDRQLAPEVK